MRSACHWQGCSGVGAPCHWTPVWYKRALRAEHLPHFPAVAPNCPSGTPTCAECTQLWYPVWHSKRFSNETKPCLESPERVLYNTPSIWQIVAVWDLFWVAGSVGVRLPNGNAWSHKIMTGTSVPLMRATGELKSSLYMVVHRFEAP